jgi:anti-anti-sigma factor
LDGLSIVGGAANAAIVRACDYDHEGLTMGLAWERLRSLDDRARYVLEIVAVAIAYAASGKLGLHFAHASTTVTAIWPPTGIALAALVLGGYRLWPGVALGALLANANTDVPAVTVFGIVVGNTLEALVGAFLLRRVADFRPGLERVRDVIALVLFGAVVSTIVAATVGVTSLLVGGVISWAHAASLWRTWWLGDMGGDLIVAPAVLIAANYRRYRQLPGTAIEGLILAIVLSVVSVLVFSRTTSVVYALFPLLIWAALRFWQPGAAVATLLTCTVAVEFTGHGKGPFAMSGPTDSLLLAQTFVAVLGVTALVLAAVTSERRRAEEAEHEIAETLQRSLLPDAAPSVTGWEVATLYRPAGAGEVEVGGDFYDFFPAPDGWIVIIGDVAGKGVPAAAMAGLVRNGARFVSQGESRPAAILARLDDALRQRPAVSLCSALCMGVNSDHLLVSSAGHPGPVVVRRDGRVREIGGAGPLLGLASGGNWPERTVRVGPDETVLLYTDGVTDTEGKTERFGERRLTELLIKHADEAPDALLAELETALDGFQLGPQSDDTAALALRLERLPGEARTRSRFAAPRVGFRLGSRPPGFRLQTALTGDAAVIKVAGELDHATAERLTEEFERRSPDTGAQLILDLAEVTFVDSAGVGALVDIERRARERRLALRTVSPPADVRAVFRLSGIEPVGDRAEDSSDEGCDLEYPERVVLELAVDNQAPRQARAEVREALVGRVSESDLDVAVLITSELVTNAVVHPVHRDGASIGLWIGADEGRARVVVTDSGRGFEPGELTRDDNAAGGRGLVVVDRGATRWGTSKKDGFSVWFELASERRIAERADARETRGGSDGDDVVLDHGAAA